MIKYICDVCGAEFEEEHWEGGYIDHMNLACNRHIYSDPGRYAELVEDIVFCDGALRDKADVETRLNCVMHWDGIPNNFKQNIKDVVESFPREEF